MDSREVWDVLNFESGEIKFSTSKAEIFFLVHKK